MFALLVCSAHSSFGARSDAFGTVPNGCRHRLWPLSLAMRRASSDRRRLIERRCYPTKASPLRALHPSMYYCLELSRNAGAPIAVPLAGLCWSTRSVGQATDALAGGEPAL